jgi:hypothetical protein
MGHFMADGRLDQNEVTFIRQIPAMQVAAMNYFQQPLAGSANNAWDGMGVPSTPQPPIPTGVPVYDTLVYPANAQAEALLGTFRGTTGGFSPDVLGEATPRSVSGAGFRTGNTSIDALGQYLNNSMSEAEAVFNSALSNTGTRGPAGSPGGAPAPGTPGQPGNPSPIPPSGGPTSSNTDPNDPVRQEINYLHAQIAFLAAQLNTANNRQETSYPTFQNNAVILSMLQEMSNRLSALEGRRPDGTASIPPTQPPATGGGVAAPTSSTTPSPTVRPAPARQMTPEQLGNLHFVRDLYRNTLKRQSTNEQLEQDAGVQMWAERINNGTMTRDQVQAAIRSSQEGIRVNGPVPAPAAPATPATAAPAVTPAPAPAAQTPAAPAKSNIDHAQAARNFVYEWNNHDETWYDSGKRDYVNRFFSQYNLADRAEIMNHISHGDQQGFTRVVLYGGGGRYGDYSDSDHDCNASHYLLNDALRGMPDRQAEATHLMINPSQHWPGTSYNYHYEQESTRISVKQMFEAMSPEQLRQFIAAYPGGRAALSQHLQAMENRQRHKNYHNVQPVTSDFQAIQAALRTVQ